MAIALGAALCSDLRADSGHDFTRVFGPLPALPLVAAPTPDALTVIPEQPASAVPVRKNALYATLLSLALPGAGEYYVGATEWTRNFVISEAALWAAFGAFKGYSGWLDSDMQAYAILHAGVTTAGKDDDYFIDIGNFDNIEEYNQYRMRRRNSIDLYPNTAQYAWTWDSRTNRWRYRDLRVRRDTAEQRALFSLGLVIANHIVSGINALRVARLHNMALEGSRNNLEIHLGAVPRNDGLTLTISRGF